MARTKSERGEKVSTVDIANNECLVCGKTHDATKTVYANGDIVVSPMRCEVCQTNHLTNLRVNGTIEKFKHLGNLKSRLSGKQRDAIIAVIAQELQVLMDKYAGTAVSTRGFDLSKIDG